MGRRGSAKPCTAIALRTYHKNLGDTLKQHASSVQSLIGGQASCAPNKLCTNQPGLSARGGAAEVGRIASPFQGKSGSDGEPPPRGAPWETAKAWRSARSSPTVKTMQKACAQWSAERAAKRMWARYTKSSCASDFGDGQSLEPELGWWAGKLGVNQAWAPQTPFSAALPP